MVSSIQFILYAKILIIFVLIIFIILLFKTDLKKLLEKLKKNADDGYGFDEDKKDDVLK